MKTTFLVLAFLVNMNLASAQDWNMQSMQMDRGFQMPPPNMDEGIDQYTPRMPEDEPWQPYQPQEEPVCYFDQNLQRTVCIYPKTPGPQDPCLNCQ